MCQICRLYEVFAQMRQELRSCVLTEISMALIFMSSVRNDGKQQASSKWVHNNCESPVGIYNILNKSENATPELFAIYIQNYANQECN